MALLVYLHQRTHAVGKGDRSMRTQAVLALAMTLATTWGGCTTDGAPSSQGSAGSGVSGGGGSGNTGGAASCSNVSACGGPVVGSWTVASSCLKLSGNLPLRQIGTGPDCESTPITGSLQVTGKWTANGDGTYTDDTITTGDLHFSL